MAEQHCFMRSCLVHASNCTCSFITWHHKTAFVGYLLDSHSDLLCLQHNYLLHRTSMPCIGDVESQSVQQLMPSNLFVNILCACMSQLKVTSRGKQLLCWYVQMSVRDEDTLPLSLPPQQRDSISRPSVTEPVGSITSQQPASGLHRDDSARATKGVTSIIS